MNILTDELKSRIEDIINSSEAILFMKGDKYFPKCEFSKNAVNILNEAGIDFESFDVLEDEEIRQGIKIYADWPTFPQLWIKGELIGGSEIIKEMHEAGELIE